MIFPEIHLPLQCGGLFSQIRDLLRQIGSFDASMRASVVQRPGMKVLALAVLLVSYAFAEATPVNWDRQKPEVLQRFQDLIRINTSSPPGNETKAVDYLRKVLEENGIPTQTFALDPNRANLVARLKGNGSKRPLLILAHTDVVPVQREKWPLDPFGAIIKDGYVWGRGSTDDKPILTALLMTMLELKRTGAVLDRDVIFLAESGEEADPAGVGINFMVGQHFKDIEAEFAVTEGGAAVIENGRVTAVNIGTAEKLPARVRLVVNGTSGHGSVPREDNALVHLGGAVQKVGTWRTPMRLSDTTRTYFEKLAQMSPPEKAARYNALLNPATAEEAQNYLAKNEPQTVLDAADFGSSHHAEGRSRAECHPVASRSDTRYSSAPGREHCRPSTKK